MILYYIALHCIIIGQERRDGEAPREVQAAAGGPGDPAGVRATETMLSL